MLVEPLFGYTEEYEKMMDQLERPFEGTAESKKRAQSDLLAQFGMSLDTVAQKAKSGERTRIEPGGRKNRKSKASKGGRKFGDDTAK